MGSMCPSDRSDYLKAAEASIYINVEQRGRVRGGEVGSGEQLWGPALRWHIDFRDEVRLLARRTGSATDLSPGSISVPVLTQIPC